MEILFHNITVIIIKPVKLDFVLLKIATEAKIQNITISKCIDE